MGNDCVELPFCAAVNVGANGDGRENDDNRIESLWGRRFRHHGIKGACE